ncbi:MAG: aminotransferase class IV [Bacteroidota bacterium]|nr:aminotransferase class IV [Bacteroidota bacterium]MDX5430152.1 aminotransferase class IV [Bacteroidota bacterium]MDX5468913.1 aminotransferase class IV [Bacteroidota bacterium]
MKQERTINLNGTYYSAGKLISTSNRAFLYGDSVFESIRFDSDVLLWPLHYARLLRAAAAFGFDFYPWWTEDYFRYEIKKTINQNKLNSARVRLILFREEEGTTYTPTSDKCSYLIDVMPLTEPAYSSQEKGLEAGIFTEVKKYPSPYSAYKSGQSMLYVMASRKAKKEAWDEVLILNQNEKICESNTGNVWMIKGKLAITPPLEDGGISGVMRDHLMRWLPEKGIAIKEESIHAEKLKDADEIWISNAVRGIRWISSLNGKNYGSNLAREIQELLHKENKS